MHFRAPVTEVERLARELGDRPVNGDWTPYVFQRRAACNFGWDWGPKVATAGLRAAPRLEAWDGARLAAVRPVVRVCTAAEAIVDVCVDVELAESAARQESCVSCRLELDDGRVIEGAALHTAARAGRATMVVVLVVPNPPRWWPRGEGAQRLHALSVSLSCGAHGETDRWSRRIGLRTVALVTERDGQAAFLIRVNGRDIFIKGANWIPEGLFQGPGVEGAVEERLVQACDANLNALRVWGGGAYERDRFYERCDELGLLLWHDFMFACATYPEEGRFPALVEAEARHQVARLMHHPSIMLWCGGNENVWGWFGWGWKERLREGQSWGWKYWGSTLPSVCAELDPSRPYWIDSPWSGSLDRFPNDRSVGDCHLWDVALEQYRAGVAPLFVSEFGCQGYPNWETLQERLGGRAEFLSLPSAELARRQQGTGGDAPFIDAHFVGRFSGAPSTQEERVRWSQLVQAYAVKTGIVWWRLSRPRCMGAIVWMFNDAWAGPSQSAIDVAGRPKPMYFELRDACAPRRLWIVPMAGPDGAATDRLAVRGVNDLPEEWRGHCELTVEAGGEVVHSERLAFSIAPASAGMVAPLDEILDGQLLSAIQSGAATVRCETAEGVDAWPAAVALRT
ncbi:MAG: glycoside hydrolase family 2 protein [Planctomycetota bacterium]|nr:glycoside hydrolase family 2 protein [Planctomycetota bacterium]MDA1106267.1 glycoside hydrolase family 2 protein [Planctomycetota bacterium]